MVGVSMGGIAVWAVGCAGFGLAAGRAGWAALSLLMAMVDGYMCHHWLEQDSIDRRLTAAEDETEAARAPFLVEAQREVDAMLPGTTPIAPPRPSQQALAEATGAQNAATWWLGQATAQQANVDISRARARHERALDAASERASQFAGTGPASTWSRPTAQQNHRAPISDVAMKLMTPQELQLAWCEARLHDETQQADALMREYAERTSGGVS